MKEEKIAKCDKEWEKGRNPKENVKLMTEKENKADEKEKKRD